MVIRDKAKLLSSSEETGLFVIRTELFIKSFLKLGLNSAQ